MTAFEAVAAIIVAFFGFGIVMGVLIVVALPVFRRYNEERRRIRSNRRRYLDGGDWQDPPPDHEAERKPPRWPGG